MSIVRMRNTITGEFSDVDDASVDFIRMKREVGPNNQPKWEQTGDHDMRATIDRARRGQLLETDLGQAAFPLPLTAGTPMLSPEAAPHKALTPGEIENGIESQEDKAQQESDMHMRSLLSWADDNQLKAAREQAEKGEGPLATHPSFARERALSLGTAAVLERSELDEDTLGEDAFEDEEEAPRQQRRRAAKSRAHRSRAGGPKSDDDVQSGDGASEDSES